MLYVLNLDSHKLLKLWLKKDFMAWMTFREYPDNLFLIVFSNVFQIEDSL